MSPGDFFDIGQFLGALGVHLTDILEHVQLIAPADMDGKPRPEQEFEIGAVVYGWYDYVRSNCDPT